MHNKRLKIIFLSAFFLLLASLYLPLSAQCAMCRATSESNYAAGGSDPNGLNAGILYMLMLPYLVVGGIALWWWRNRKAANTEIPLPERDESAYN